MNDIRTRFAPSPTGFQHVGGFRTAIYAWLWAKKNNGQFILRIEDTDQERYVQGAIKYIVDSLAWLGIDYDEGPTKELLEKLGEDSENAITQEGSHGPYIQSFRKDIYKQHVEQLIAEGKAYRCDCTPERLEQERNEQMARREKPGYSGYCRTRDVSADQPHVVRFKLPDQISVKLNDCVRGNIAWENPPLRDPVLFKSDGFPTYHLASVVDDHLMKISHVMRGEEWLPTTPIHLLLYEAFGWDKPEFVHLSHILGPDGKKLSKRHGAVALNEYADQGIIAPALLNYVTLIGWSPGDGDNQEIFTIDELIQKFSLKGLGSSSGVFDQQKLEWMNGAYFRSLSVERFSKLAEKQLKDILPVIGQESWEIIAPHVQERIRKLDEIQENVHFLTVENLERDLHEIFKGPVDQEVALKIFESAKKSLESLQDFSVENVDSALKDLVTALDLKMGQVLVPIRIAVAGKKATPPLSDSIVALGRDKACKRLEEMPAILENYQQ